MPETRKQTRPIEILMVEDSPDDVELTKESLKGAKMSFKLNVAEDGVEAMDYLKREGRFADAYEHRHHMRWNWMAKTNEAVREALARFRASEAKLP